MTISNRQSCQAAVVTLAKFTLIPLLLVSLSSCSSFSSNTRKPELTPAVTQQPVPEPEITDIPEKEPSLYEWNGNGRIITRIVVNTSEQKATVYSGQDVVGWTTVATGVRSHPTPTGKFSVMEKVANKRSNLYGQIYGESGKLLKRNAKMGMDPVPDGARFEGAKMPYFLRLTNDGIGLHAGPIPHPGRAASHGCIRMPKDFAPILFAHVSEGTSVSIVGRGPTYASYLKTQQRLAAERRAKAAVTTAATQPTQQQSGQDETTDTNAVTAPNDEAQPALETATTGSLAAVETHNGSMTGESTSRAPAARSPQAEAPASSQSSATSTDSVSSPSGNLPMSTDGEVGTGTSGSSQEPMSTDSSANATSSTILKTPTAGQAASDSSTGTTPDAAPTATPTLQATQSQTSGETTSTAPSAPETSE